MTAGSSNITVPPVMVIRVEDTMDVISADTTVREVYLGHKH